MCDLYMCSYIGICSCLIVYFHNVYVHVQYLLCSASAIAIKGACTVTINSSLHAVYSKC